MSKPSVARAKRTQTVHPGVPFQPSQPPVRAGLNRITRTTVLQSTVARIDLYAIATLIVSMDTSASLASLEPTHVQWPLSQLASHAAKAGNRIAEIVVFHVAPVRKTLVLPHDIFFCSISCPKLLLGAQSSARRQMSKEETVQIKATATGGGVRASVGITALAWRKCFNHRFARNKCV